MKAMFKLSAVLICATGICNFAWADEPNLQSTAESQPIISKIENGIPVVADNATKPIMADPNYALEQLDLGNAAYEQQNYTQAVEHYQLAASHRNAQAQAKLAMMYLDGRGVKQNFKNTLFWATRSAEQNCAEGQYLMAALYLKGYGVSQSYREAAQWLTKAAEQGYVNAQVSLGLLYAGDLTVLGAARKWLPDDYQTIYEQQTMKPDMEKAKYWLTKAIEQGSAQAQYEMGRMYDDSYFYQRSDGYVLQDIDKQHYQEDEKKAIEWYEKAAAQNYAQAEYALGEKYYNSPIRREVLSEREKKGLAFIERAAKHDLPAAQQSLFNFYYDYGHYKDAAYWAEKCGEHGGEYTDNLIDAARIYSSNDFGITDYDKAISLYKKAIELGYIKGYRQLGDVYLEGKIVPKDNKLAKQYYLDGCDRGDDESCQEWRLFDIRQKN